MQSWFSAVGGIAKGTGPAYITYMYVSTGPAVIPFICNDIVQTARALS